MNRKDTLARLNMEREYEERIVSELHTYFLASLENISDITDQEKGEIRNKLLDLITDSKRHSFLFNTLMQEVLEHEDADY